MAKCRPILPILLIFTASIPSCANPAIKQTIKPYQEAVDANPLDARTHYDLGAAYLAVEKYKSAQKAFMQCLELDPLHMDARLKLAQALDNLEEPVLANRYIREVIEADSTNLEANEKLGARNLSLIYVFEAFSQHEEPIAEGGLTPSQFRLLDVNKLSLDEFRSMYDETLMIWHRLVRLEPDNPENWCGLGAIQNQMEDFSGSTESYRRVQRLDQMYLVESPLHSSVFFASRDKEKWIPPMPDWRIILMNPEILDLLAELLQIPPSSDNTGS